MNVQNISSPPRQRSRGGISLHFSSQSFNSLLIFKSLYTLILGDTPSRPNIFTPRLVGVLQPEKSTEEKQVCSTRNTFQLKLVVVGNF